MSTDSLQVSRDGAVTVIRLVRPDRRNAIDASTAGDLTALLEVATGDSAIRAIVITGEGRDFCTGADVAPGDGAGLGPLDYRYATEGYRRLFRALWEVERPVVSAVNSRSASTGARSRATWRRLSKKSGTPPRSSRRPLTAARASSRSSKVDRPRSKAPEPRYTRGSARSWAR